jgi:hypothetical protein
MWGTANRVKGKVTLYRWSVWVLIHELGHIVTPIEFSLKGRRVMHGRNFGLNTTKIYQLWNKFNERDN